MPDDVTARLQRVDERLRDCYTQQTRLVEDITALQKKREFLQSLGEPIDLPGQRPKSPPVAQPRPSPPTATDRPAERAVAVDRGVDRPVERTAAERAVERAAERALDRAAERPVDQPAAEPAASEPGPSPAPQSNIDALLVSAQSQVTQLLHDSRLFATKAQEIVGVLTAINNVLVLAGPEGRPRLTDLGRNLVAMLNGMVQDVPGGAGAGSEIQAVTGTRQNASFFPQLFTLLQSPVVEALLSTLTAMPRATVPANLG